MPSIETCPTILTSIINWKHWNTVQIVAQKEYHISEQEFTQILPEYQRFLGLILAGNTHIGMYSEQVDTIWHSHILCTTLYTDFCERIFGEYIHHIPNLTSINDAKCEPPCSFPCLSKCKTPQPKCTETEVVPRTFAQFVAVYIQLYGEQPPLLWYQKIERN